MRRLPLGIGLLVAPLAAALAQQPAQTVLPAPRVPVVQTPGGPESLQPPALAPPAAPQTNGTVPAAEAPAAPQPAPAPAPAAPAPPAPAPPPPNVWLPKPVADLVALDKVTARTTPITVRVGQSASFGSLTIAVRACDVRPPDQPADATAFLDITDSHAGGPQFHGWMVVSAPSVSMLEHPIYDVRLVGCHE